MRKAIEMKWTTLAVAGIAFLTAACGGPETEVSTPPDTTASMTPVASGEETFMAYCASCHGEDGTGNGPVAAVMSAPPADLTQLRANHGGSFSVDSVYAYIDGRAEVQAHGTRDMPVWGNVWGETVSGEPVPREEVDLRIRELVEYIRTLQREPAS